MQDWNVLHSCLARVVASDQPVIIDGDLNARHKDLGDSVTCPAGKYLIESASKLGLSIVNAALAFGVSTSRHSTAIIDWF